MDEVTVTLVEGVECVEVDHGLYGSIQQKLVLELAGNFNICGLCPKKSGHNCNCPHALGNRQRRAKQPVTHPDHLWFPLKYWPILKMRIADDT